jgi:predicted transcriptional regulator YdeE
MYVITRQWFYGVYYKCGDFFLKSMHPPPNIKTLDDFKLVDFTKLTSASKAEKAISQLWDTLTCESLTEDLIGLNMFVPCMSLLDSGSMVSTISVATFF